ncbi:protein translocase subunit SecF [Sciscionella sediminilitoris]|uniref:protein translocase subunit SecF n=1 Tax=Sciscionella sediminilitoris TaxID=1445613 RepID=UPI000563A079|nr:protein translocase subunit SecF [Sciscionella sp. SE31]
MTTTSTSSTGDNREEGGFFHRLHTGTGALDIVGKRKRWYIVFAALLVIAVISMVVRGFNFGIDFEGGTKLELPAHGANGTISVEQAGDAFTKSLGHTPEAVQSVGTGSSASIQIRTTDLNAAQTAKVKSELFNDLKPIGADGQASQESITDSAVSASWGGDISQQALIALAVFLVLVAVFLAFYFERWMAVAAIMALFNDIIVTAGVYSLVGFEVTPATVIGLLTILGFSLYDTVVVFDKVRENTRGLLGLTRRTYPEAANLAVNQTLMRSINTSLIALLPVLGLLIVGVALLGTGTLTDLALVQMVGMISGALSSICLATPLLVDFKMREQPYRRQQARVFERRRKLAGRVAATEDVDTGDDEALAAELRNEQAMAAASSVPARPGKSGAAHRAGQQKGGKPPQGKGQSKTSQGKGQQQPRPTGKSNRPSGKRRS